MNEYQILRAVMLHIGAKASAKSPLAKALKTWTLNNLAWLDLGLRKKKVKNWDAMIAAFHRWRLPEMEMPYAMKLADSLAQMLELNADDHLLLSLLIAADRLPHISALADLAAKHGLDLPTLMGELCGIESHDAARFVRNSPVIRLGLLRFQSNRRGETFVDMPWSLEQLFDKAPALDSDWIDALIGLRQSTELDIEDFAHVADAGFLRDLVRGAVEQKASGINILIHGPPGTGKTEFARVLAKAAGLRLHAVGEVDVDGQEPNRYERVHALALSQRVLASKSDSLLLFDEMEDFVGRAQKGTGGQITKREGSKIFANRLLENNTVPVIWTTNYAGNIDDAIIRRMSHVLKLDYPAANIAKRIYARIADDEKVTVSEQLGSLIHSAPETATILRNAARAHRIAGCQDGDTRSAYSLVKTLRGGSLPLQIPGDIDLDLYQCDPPLAPLIGRLAKGEFLDVSLMLSGPPGTGKTALAHHFARAMDRPLLEQRASDLLSKWVGETEANIAGAFEHARERQGILFFDEADSLMFDRSNADRNWEVSQVNELLSWLDRHDLPVLAATNHAAKLDPATLRRFDYKIELLPLQDDLLSRAFTKFFELDAPQNLRELCNLTPGDFAVVRRQLRHNVDRSSRAILAALQRESALKPDRNMPMGF